MSKKADGIYESEACRELFEQAWKRFPRYNTSQADEAADWILDELVASKPKVKWTESLRTELYEAIYAGLT